MSKGVLLRFTPVCGLITTLEETVAGFVCAQFHKAELKVNVFFKVFLYYTLALFLSSAFSPKNEGLRETERQDADAALQ